MSFFISTGAEILKTKRTAAFWLTIIGAAFIPAILFIALFTDGDAHKNLANDPWGKFFGMGWQILSVFLLPMYIILVCTLVTQIEYKNNAWKQVFSSPQSLSNIIFSKFATLHIMIIFCFLLFNAFMIVSALLGNAFNAKYTFMERSIDWEMLVKLNLRTYLSILGISAIQYWLSLRFKNFIAPVGIGLVMVIASIIARNYHWEYLFKFPYAFALLTFESIEKKGRPVIENHELNSIGYFLFFILVIFLDMKLKKEKG